MKSRIRINGQERNSRTLETLEFIRESQNVIMYGNPGTGKTHTALGLGIKACQAGYNVLYASVPRLLVEIRETESQRKLSRLQKRFEKYDLWDQIFTDKVIAAAIVDRLTFKAYIIDMNGPSYRIKATQKWMKDRKMNTFAEESLPVQLSVAKLFTFRWQFTIREAKQS